MPKRNFKIKQAFLWIVVSTLLISGSVYTIFFSYKISKYRKLKSKNHKIMVLLQTGSKKNALPTQYLAELLELSKDKPKNYFAFDEKDSLQKLLSSPYISSAKIKKINPNAVYVDYEVRNPFALLSDYENIAVDQDGYVFPLAPFYSEENLPKIFLGLPRFSEPEDEQKREGGSWDKPLRSQHFALAKKVFNVFDEKQFQNQFTVKKIDVSHAFAPSFGQREIVVELEEKMHFTQNSYATTFIFPKYLRLNEKEYAKQLSNFFVLSQKMRNDYRRQIQLSKKMPTYIRCKAKLLDFRIPQLAFIKEDE